MSEIEEQLKAMIDARASVGLKKYNVDLMRDDYDLDKWLELAIEEALDQAAYMQRARAMLKANREMRLDTIDSERIPWDECHEAEWVVKNRIGEYWFFVGKPILSANADGWIFQTEDIDLGELIVVRGACRIPGDWRDSRRKRPEGV